MTAPGVPVNDERIAALVDGELAPADVAAIEAAAATDPALTARIERARALRTAIAGAFADAMAEPPPPLLLATIRGGGHVVDLSRARAARTSVGRIPVAAQWGAVAASLALAFVAGRWLMTLSSPVISSGSGGLAANGALAAGLERQLASDQLVDASVMIGVSFRATDGDYCRTFALRQAQPIAGLACRDPDGWRVRIAAQAPPLAAPGGFRTAGDEIPAPVMESVDQLIQGAPLDAAAEAKARAAGWRAVK